jgi:hypothetical protein
LLLKQEFVMAYEYPELPTNRPDPTLEDGHKAPDRRKTRRSYGVIAAAVAGILAIAAVAAITTNESEKHIDRAAVQQGK